MNHQKQVPEHPSTYFVQDRSNKEDLTRLHIQDQMLTTCMGGVFPEQPNPTAFRRVLDVGCGTGGWLIEVAKAYPSIELLIGVDASKYLVEFARKQAQTQGVHRRVEFHVMDALRMLEFSTGFFDLVNQRLGMSYLRTWDWPKLLQEYRRVLQPGGIIRITEGDFLTESRSPALLRLQELAVLAFYHAGHLFTQSSDGATRELPHLLHQHSCQQVQIRAHRQEYRAGTPEGKLFLEDITISFRIILPFLRKWIRLPNDYEDLYQQMLQETRQADFVAEGRMLTVWGKTSPVPEALYASNR